MNVAKHSLSKSNPPQPTTDQESPSLFDEPQAAKPTLAESEALLHGLFEYAPDAIIVVDSQGYIARLNAQAETMFGYSRAELLGQPLELLLPERFREQHVAYRLGYMIEARLRPMGAGLELFGRRKDGTELAVDIMLSPLESSDEAIVIAVIRDVTERKRSQEKFQGLLESAPDVMVIVNQAGQIVLVNAQTEELFGYKRDQLLGQWVEMLLPEQFRLSHIKHRQNYFMAPQTRSMGRGLELYGLRQDGETFPIEVSLSTLETEDGLLVSSAIRDITQRKQIEAEQAQLAAIVESSDVAIIGKNLDGIITSWNRGAERIYGYTVDEVKGQSVSLLVPPNQPDETPQIMQKIRQGEVTEQYETVRIRKDGSSIHVALAVSPIKDTNGHIVGASVIARDISERKQAETQLRASLKEKEALLKEIHTIYEVYYDIYLLNQKGIICASAIRQDLIGQDQSDRDWFQQTNQGKLTVTDMYKSETAGAYTVSYCAPVKNRTGQIVGVITTRFNWNFIVDIINAALVYSDCQVYLLNLNGFVIASANNKDFLKRDFSKFEAFRLASEGNNGFIVESDPETNHIYLIGYARTEGYNRYKGKGWIILILQHKGFK